MGAVQNGLWPRTKRNMARMLLEGDHMANKVSGGSDGGYWRLPLIREESIKEMYFEEGAVSMETVVAEKGDWNCHETSGPSAR